MLDVRALTSTKAVNVTKVWKQPPWCARKTRPHAFYLQQADRGCSREQMWRRSKKNLEGDWRHHSCCPGLFFDARWGEKKKESERKPGRRWQHTSSGSWCRVCFHWLLRDVDLKSLMLKIVHCYSVWIIQNLVKITNNHADTTHLRTSQGSPQPIIDLFLTQCAAASPRTCPLLSAAVNPVEALPPGSLPGRSV